MKSKKSLAIQTFVGWLFAQVAIGMSSVAHLPFNGWNWVILALVSVGSLASVYSICDIFRLLKESKKLDAELQELVEKLKFIKEKRLT